MEKVHTFDNDVLVSSKDASKLLNCSHDYIGRLCREGKVYGEKIGRTWYVSQNSLREFKKEITQIKEERRQELSETIKSSVLVHKNRNWFLTNTGVYFLFAIFAVWILFMFLWIPTAESTRDRLASDAWSYIDTMISTLEQRASFIVVNTSKWFRNSASSFAALTGDEEKSDPVEKRGVVVSGDDQIDVVDVQNIFSDTVQIDSSEDGVSGIITPIFKEVSDEDYVYVLVPLNEE